MIGRTGEMLEIPFFKQVMFRPNIRTGLKAPEDACKNPAM
jgi:hypothetical protein